MSEDGDMCERCRFHLVECSGDESPGACGWFEPKRFVILPAIALIALAAAVAALFK